MNLLKYYSSEKNTRKFNPFKNVKQIFNVPSTRFNSETNEKEMVKCIIKIVASKEITPENERCAFNILDTYPLSTLITKLSGS